MFNVTRRTAYVVLGIAMAVELTGDGLLEASDGYRNKLIGAASILLIMLSFFLLSKILHVLNLAVVYATWSAMGAFVTVMIGIIFFGQHLNVIGWISIAALAAGTVVLDIWGMPPEDSEAENPEAASLETKNSEAENTTTRNSEAGNEEAGEEDKKCQ